MNNKINCDTIEAISVASYMRMASCKRMNIYEYVEEGVYVYRILFCHLNGFQKKMRTSSFPIENHWCWYVAYTHTYPSTRVVFNLLFFIVIIIIVRDIEASIFVRVVAEQKRLCTISLEQISPVCPFKMFFNILITYTAYACMYDVYMFA